MTPIVLDGGDRRCVLLLLELRRLTTTVPSGALIRLIASDPAAPLDLPAWCHLTGHAYLGPVPGEHPTYAVQVADVTALTDPQSPWRPAPTGP
ncbi:sulfurtransferase TusA family protein [Micromonospora sp. Llam7]|uniref:sulfurtransferase TusA family protein n=1 Tax=Micromonospora tarapacensis TaxID=2835305 RepID=UPI001C82F329|nr:sulfurtransferase TusA family protein [Micromonospora tarapacensis]MBX7270110.1 sulfurtransferase TusA family protein [Micromonospora tarapacensis]